jgi:hypothetical protein
MASPSKRYSRTYVAARDGVLCARNTYFLETVVGRIGGIATNPLQVLFMHA